MDFALSRAVASNFEYRESTGSTNTDLVAAAAGLPDFSVLVAGFQTAGRGRSGRDWTAPSGSSLFVSVLLKPGPQFDRAGFSWLPLMAGLAMSNAVASFINPIGVRLKWPNDVLVNEKKISGVLSELLPDLSGVVIGAGLNVTQQQAELPIENATSMQLEGSKVLNLDEILQAYLAELAGLYAQFVSAGGNAVESGLLEKVSSACSSIGRRVRAILPGDKELLGEGVGIDQTGRLIFMADGADFAIPVAAADIVHLRHN